MIILYNKQKYNVILLYFQPILKIDNEVPLYSVLMMGKTHADGLFWLGFLEL